MATLSMIVRVAANMAELKRNLSEGKDIIDTTTSAMNKMVASFQGEKLIQHAHNYAAAINQLGGVERLNVQEKERVNAIISKAIEKYQLLGKDAPAALLQIQEATRSVQAPTTALTTSMVALGSAIGSFVGNIASDAVRRLAGSFAQMVKEGMSSSALIASFDRLSHSIGQSGKVMLDVTRKSTKGLIADLDIMGASNKAMLLGLPVTAKEMGTLGSAAVTLGKAMKQDATKSLDDLITALGRSSPMILDNLGLTVKVGEANEAYAAKLGKSVTALTDAEKKMAFYQAAMDAAQKKVETLGGVQLTLADTGTRLSTAFTNTAHAGGRLLELALTPLSALVSMLPSPVLSVGVAIVTLGAGAIAATAAVLGLNAAFGGSAVTAGIATTATTTLTVAVTALRTALGFLMGPLGLAVAATAALAAGVVYLKNRLSIDLEPSITQAAKGIEAYKKSVNDRALKTPAMDWDAAARAAEDLDKQIQKNIESAKHYAKIREQAFGLDKVAAANEMVKAIGGLNGVTRMSADAQASLNKLMVEAIDAATRNGQEAPIAWYRIAVATEQANTAAAQYVQTLDKISAAANNMPMWSLGEQMNKVTAGLFKGPAISDNNASQLGGSWMGSFLGGMKTSASSLWQGMTGGKGISGLFGNLGEGIMTGFGNVISGGLSSLISSGVGLAIKGLGKLFGFGGEGKEVAKLRLQFEQAAGGVEALRRSADIAGVSLDALYHTKKVKDFQAAAQQVQAQIEAFQQRVAEFPSVFETMLGTVGGQLASPQFFQLLARVEATGKFAGEIADFRTKQTQSGVAGLVSFLQTAATAQTTLAAKTKELGAVQADYNDRLRRGFEAGSGEMETLRQRIAALTAEVVTQRNLISATGVVTQQAADGMSAALLGAFGQLRAGGMSVTQALAAIAPGVDALGTQLTATGMKGGAAFEQIQTWVTLSKDAIAGPALNAVSSLNQGLVGLSNAGLMNQTIFSGLAGQVAQTFNALVTQGVQGNDALALMQPTLQTIWQLQQDFGYQVDDSTQRMLDQATTAGLVGDAHRSANERAALAMERVALLLEDFIRSLGVIQSAAQTAADRVGGIAGAVDEIPTDITVRIGFSVDDLPELPSFDTINFTLPGEPIGEFFHRGGLVRAHRGMYLGPDEIPIIAQTGEGILSRAGMEALGGPGVLGALNSGRGGSGDRPIVIHLRTDLDGKEITRKVVTLMPGELSRHGLVR